MHVMKNTKQAIYMEQGELTGDTKCSGKLAVQFTMKQNSALLKMIAVTVIKSL